MNGPERETEIYLAHMGREHHGLRHLLLKASASMVELTRNPNLADAVKDQLVGLLDFLRDHFASEEEGGALVEARNYCPSVGAEVERIFAEHGDLLADVESMIDKLRRSRPLSAKIAADLLCDFERFRHRMERHEEAENAAVARAFGTLPE